MTLRLTEEGVRPQPASQGQTCVGCAGGSLHPQSPAQLNHRMGSADGALGSVEHLLAQVPGNSTALGCGGRGQGPRGAEKHHWPKDTQLVSGRWGLPEDLEDRYRSP